MINTSIYCQYLLGWASIFNINSCNVSIQYFGRPLEGPGPLARCTLEEPPPGTRATRPAPGAAGAHRSWGEAQLVARFSDLETGRRCSSSSQVTRCTCDAPSRCCDLREAGAMLGHRFMTHTHPTSAHIFREPSACLPRITRTSHSDVKRAATFPVHNSTPSRLQEPGWRPHHHVGRPRPLLPLTPARTAGPMGALPLSCPHGRA